MLMPRVVLLGLVCALAIAAPASADRFVAPPDARELWVKHGMGALTGLAAGDADGDGSSELLLAGQGAAALKRSALTDGRPLWSFKPPPGKTPDRGGDVARAQAFASGDLDGDGVPDAVVGTSESLHALDGRDGSVMWTVTDPDWFGGISAIAVADFDGDGGLDVVANEPASQDVVARNGDDGEALWTFTRVGIPHVNLLATHDVNADGAPDVLVGGTSELLGFDLMALSGAGAAALGRPTLLWVARTGDPTGVAFGQVVAGGGEELAVSSYHGDLTLLDALTGAELASWTVDGNGRLNDVVVTQVDADAAAEVIAAVGHNDDNGDSRAVRAYDVVGPSAVPLWTWDPPQAAYRLAVADAGLVVSGGWWEFRGRDEQDGFVATLDPTDGKQKWLRYVPDQADRLLVGEVFGDDAVVVGSTRESEIRAFRPDGEPLWRHLTGGTVRALAHGDLDADGQPEIIEGSDDGEVSAYTAAGDLRFRTRVPNRGGPQVMTVAAGDLDGATGHEVVAGTFEFARRAPGGFVHAYAADGSRLWSLPRIGDVGTVLVEDLDGRGPDVIVGSNGLGLAGGGAQLARLRGDGSPIWDVDLPPSMIKLPVRVADLNGDSTLDLVVGTFPFGAGIILGFDGATGDELWRVPLRYSGQWLDADRRGHIAAGDMGGSVTRIDANGAVLWRRDQVGAPSRYGSVSLDLDGDGAPEVASTFDDDRVRMLDGQTGEQLWAAPLGDEEEYGGPIATVRSPGADVLLAGSLSSVLGRREVLATFDPQTGERLGTLPTLWHVLEIHPADLDRDGDQEALAGSGFQLHVVDPDGDRAPPRAGALGPVEVANRNDFRLDFDDVRDESSLAAAWVRIGDAVQRLVLVDGKPSLAGLELPGEGRWTVSAWLEDARGNRDSQTAVEVGKVLDQTPPRLDFADGAFAVSDGLSGVERAVLRERRGDAWADVPEAAFADGRLSAPAPPRRTRWQAIAVDRAGNEAVVEVDVGEAAAETPGGEADAGPPGAVGGGERCAPSRSRGGFSRGLRLRRRGTRIVVRVPARLVARLRKLTLERLTPCGWLAVREVGEEQRLRLPSGTYRLRATLPRGRTLRGRARSWGV